MIRPSAFRIASSTGDRPSLQTHLPRLWGSLQPKQDTQPVNFSSLYRSMISTSAPWPAAPFAASRIKVAVFQAERGLQLMAMIFFMEVSSLCVFFYFIVQENICKQKNVSMGSGKFMHIKKAAHRPPNINIIPYWISSCLFSVSPTFCIISYITSHLAKGENRMYDEGTKKE